MFKRNANAGDQIIIYKPKGRKLKEIGLYIMAASFLPIS
jgi:hypothetical protein